MCRAGLEERLERRRTRCLDTILLIGDVLLAGRLGPKSGRGFYDYAAGDKTPTG